MSSEAQRKAFWDQVEALRSASNRPQLAEIARLAMEVGLSVREALAEVQNYVEYRPANALSNALALFVSSVCESSKASSVMEYTSTVALLTARLIERDVQPRVAYISPDRQVADTLRELFHVERATISEGIRDLPEGEQFSAIVCQPPLGHRPTGTKYVDGFGGEIVRQLVTHLTPDGILLWVTGRGVISARRAQQTISDFGEIGLFVSAVIDVPPGGFPGTMVEGTVVAMRRTASGRKLVGVLRDAETAESLAWALLAGPTRKSGASWTWLWQEDARTFGDLEQERLLQKLTPRGRFELKLLRELLVTDRIHRADRPLSDEDEAVSYLFVPEYAGSRVTADVTEQSVKLRAVYRFPVDPAKANSRFLVQLLNSSYGRQLRASSARGATIQRTSANALLELALPVPDLATQNQIARIAGDIRILNAAFSEMQDTLEHDWTDLSEVAIQIDSLKAILDIERRIADWWSELPYPLATIYRRYQVSTEPKERLDTLLHFFEMAAVYLAAVGVSHVRELRQDWREVVGKWLHPPRGAGIERADFGFWIGLARVSLKDANRIASDKDLRAAATEIAGPELVQAAAAIGHFSKAMATLDTARRYRNSWKGHGGHIKASDAARLDNELQQSIRDFYEISASLFRRLKLVRPGRAEVTDTGIKFEVETLCGSDPAFKKLPIELNRPIKSNALAFWMDGSRTMCRASPFFRLGAPQQPQESSFYVFNRVENGGFRWICYQEAREQEYIAPDEELLKIINLGRNEE